MWFFGYRIPWSPGGIENLVRGKFFWEHLDEAGIPTTIVRAPDNFPPRETGARTFSGMGTPDLLGTMGVFSDPFQDGPHAPFDLFQINFFFFGFFRHSFERNSFVFPILSLRAA